MDEVDVSRIYVAFQVLPKEDRKRLRGATQRGEVLVSARERDAQRMLLRRGRVSRWLNAGSQLLFATMAVPQAARGTRTGFWGWPFALFFVCSTTWYTYEIWRAHRLARRLGAARESPSLVGAETADENAASASTG